MVIVNDSSIEVRRLVLGPWGTNAYVIICQETRESVLIDSPADASEIIQSLAGTKPQHILITHVHIDHIGALPELRFKLKATLAAHSSDANGLPYRPGILLNHGDSVLFGAVKLEVIHTPGHTPGSLCFKLGKHLFSGDTIFPGGPGKTESPTAFKDILKSITDKIMVLPDDLEIYPGHGDSASLKKEKEKFAVFSARSHDPNLCGDVLWLSS